MRILLEKAVCGVGGNRPPAKTKTTSCSRCSSKTCTGRVPRHSLRRPSTSTMVRHLAGPTHPAHAYAPCPAYRSPSRCSQSPKSKSLVQEPGKQRRKKRRRTAASTPPTRARRLTIDPLRWGSTHIGGVFLEGERTLVSLALDAGGESSGKTRESSEVEGDEEVEEILDASQSPADDNDRAIRTALFIIHSALIQRTLTWLRRRRLHCDFCTPCSVRRTKIGAERRTLILIWNGRPPRRIRLPTHLKVPVCMTLPTLKSFPPLKGHPKSRLLINDRPYRPTAAAPRNPDPVQPPTTNTLKDLFAPREEEGERISHLTVIGVVQLHSPVPFIHHH